jgi:pimeloyl-ACP methyl ester carboxylesterase
MKNMKRMFPLLIVFMGLIGILRPVAAADPAPVAPSGCVDRQRENGELYRICMPDLVAWNGDLVVYAHGYVPEWEPLAIPAEATQIGTAVTFQGYAFATTSYRTNGLAVLPAIEDLQLLVDEFTLEHPEVEDVLLIGFSQGGLITTLSVERFPQIYDGGLSGCGPIGGAQPMLDYFINFRIIFDYFFPGLMPGSPLDIPADFMDGLADESIVWDDFFTDNIAPDVTAPENASLVDQLLRVTDAPYDLSHATETISDALRYSVYAAHDMSLTFAASPFDNQDTVYTGSDDDAALNAAVPRYTADPDAQAALAAYDTGGDLTVPLVTLHTTLDPIVPFWHDTLYAGKVSAAGADIRHDSLPVERYGHCNFETNEVLSAFDLLVDRVDNPPAEEDAYYLFLPAVQQLAANENE